MATKRNSFITDDLDWAEIQLSSWKEYIDTNPLHTLKDRIEWKPTSRGGSIPLVIASVEQQGKFLQETMKNYLQLLEVVDRLREKEELKREARGDSHIPERMKNRE